MHYYVAYRSVVFLFRSGLCVILPFLERVENFFAYMLLHVFDAILKHMR